MFACTAHTTKFENRTPYNSKGFAYIYNDQDFNDKILKRKLDNNKLEISHRDLKINTLIKITNPKTNDSITTTNKKIMDYPFLYKILITKEVANRLNIDPELPLVEISEIKKNKSFIAKKAKIFNEEKKLSSNAPVESVKISNISKNKKIQKKRKSNKFYILIATFYSKETAEFLKQRIVKESPNYDINKLKIKKKNNKEIDLISGPYMSVNLMKNDYSLLKDFGFEELNVTIYD